MTSDPVSATSTYSAAVLPQLPSFAPGPNPSAPSSRMISSFKGHETTKPIAVSDTKTPINVRRQSGLTMEIAVVGLRGANSIYLATQKSETLNCFSGLRIWSTTTVNQWGRCWDCLYVCSAEVESRPGALTETERFQYACEQRSSGPPLGRRSLAWQVWLIREAKSLRQLMARSTRATPWELQFCPKTGTSWYRR